MTAPDRFSRKMFAVFLVGSLGAAAPGAEAAQAVAPRISAPSSGAAASAVAAGAIRVMPLAEALAPAPAAPVAAGLPVGALANGQELLARLEAPGAEQDASALAAFFSGSAASTPDEPVPGALAGGMPDNPDHVVTTPDGKWILTAKGGDVQSWDAKTRRLAWEFRGSREGKDGHRSYEVFQVSDDGAKLGLARAYTGDVWILETGSGKVSKYLSPRVSRGVEETVLSRDGSLVGQSNFYGESVLAEVGSGKIFLSLKHASGVSPHMRYRLIGFSPDNRWMEVVAYTKERHWDVSLLRGISRVPLVRRIPHLITWVKDLFH